MKVLKRDMGTKKQVDFMMCETKTETDSYVHYNVNGKEKSSGQYKMKPGFMKRPSLKLQALVGLLLCALHLLSTGHAGMCIFMHIFFIF